MSKKKIITHNGGFHPDDVFAVATLLLYLGDEESEIIRTRDEEIIKTGDFVADVGMVYAPDKNLFDHHQKEGAGKRENGIPYASFGLIWKRFGEKLCGSIESAEALDKKVVQTIDAYDNGVDIFKLTTHEVFPYRIIEIILLFYPTWKEPKKDTYEKFLEAVNFAKKILSREIEKVKDEIEAQNATKDVYNKSEDKRLIVLEKEHTYGRFIIDAVLVNFPEPIYFVHHIREVKEGDPTGWQIVAVNINKGSLDLRKAFPESWRGLIGKDFSNLTGIEDAYLCHRSGFMCLAGSKEGAIKLAKLALEA